MNKSILPKADLDAEIGGRIALARKNKGLVLKELETKSRGQFAVARISNWEQGRRRPAIEDIQLLATLLEVSPAYLLTLTDDPLSSKVKSGSKRTVTVPVLSHALIQQYRRAAHISLHTILNKHPTLPTITLDPPTKSRVSTATFACPIEDDSMAPELCRGGIVIVDPGITPTHHTWVLAHLKKNQQVVIRRLQAERLTPKGQWIYHLFPNHPSYPILTNLSRRQVTVLGTVVEYRQYLQD